MFVYEVGKPHPIGALRKDHSEYNYTQAGHCLQLFLRAPTPAEQKAVQKEAAEFAVTIVGSVIYLLYRFGDHPRKGVPWSDASFSIHLVPEEVRAMPEVPRDPKTRAMIHVQLIDSDTGVIRVLRTLTLPPRVTRELAAAMHAQAGLPWHGRAVHTRQAMETCARYTSEQLLDRAVARGRGGL